jgi:hypothetical protein
MNEQITADHIPEGKAMEVMREIDSMHHLLQKGILSDKEFQRLKNQLIQELRDEQKYRHQDAIDLDDSIDDEPELVVNDTYMKVIRYAAVALPGLIILSCFLPWFSAKGMINNERVSDVYYGYQFHLGWAIMLFCFLSLFLQITGFKRFAFAPLVLAILIWFFILGYPTAISHGLSQELRSLNYNFKKYDPGKVGFEYGFFLTLLITGLGAIFSYFRKDP